MSAGYDATRLDDGTPQFADAGFCLGHAAKIYAAMEEVRRGRALDVGYRLATDEENEQARGEIKDQITLAEKVAKNREFGPFGPFGLSGLNCFKATTEEPIRKGIPARLWDDDRKCFIHPDRSVGWDHRFRRLEEGEEIRATDQVQKDDGTWVVPRSTTIGTKAPDPSYTSHRVYRRRLVSVPLIDSCPICGWHAIAKLKGKNKRHRWSVRCCSETCGTKGPVRGTEAQAISDWNKRVEASLDWLSSRRDLEVYFYSPVYGDDDDQSMEWRIARRSGSINDREWTVISSGKTPLGAVRNAMKKLSD